MKKFRYYLIVKSVGMYINLMSYLYPNYAYQLAYRLFSTPRKGKLKAAKIPTVLQQAQSVQHNFEKHVIQTYIWKGNADVVLLIHGWESNASRWKKLLKHLLKTGKTIVAIDGPAHGQSSGSEFNVPLYASFIHTIVGIYKPRILIGHSVGGNALTYYQKQFPHELNKLVLLGAPCEFKIILKNYVSLLSLNTKVFNFLKNYTQSRFAIAIEDFSAARFIADSSLKGLIIHDQDDEVVLWEESQKIAAAWPQAEFITTKGLGHSLHDNQVYQSLVDFVNCV